MAGEITLEEGGSNPPTEAQKVQIRKVLNINDEDGKVPLDQLPSRARVMSEDGLHVLMRRFRVSEDGGVNYVEFSRSGVSLFGGTTAIQFIDTQTFNDSQNYFSVTSRDDGFPDYWKGQLAVAPSNPKPGWMYYDTTLTKVCVYDSAGGWLAFNGGPA